MDDDDDMPQLPADTLRLLQDFNAEKDAREKKFQDLKAESESQFANGSTALSMDMFYEDWNASQFWYTDETANTLARQLLQGADQSTYIAVVSAPSVYVAIHNIIMHQSAGSRPQAYLLEYDERFKVLGPTFIYYDFAQPMRVPAELKGRFDRIICDPPFLSQDCQTKTALTVRLLAKSWTSPEPRNGGVRLISCTGERMEDTILKLYEKPGVRTTSFDPEHSKGLSNEFRCYANFECDAWKWR